MIDVLNAKYQFFGQNLPSSIFLVFWVMHKYGVALYFNPEKKLCCSKSKKYTSKFSQLIPSKPVNYYHIIYDDLNYYANSFVFLV